jgi:hypothetical protein
MAGRKKKTDADAPAPLPGLEEVPLEDLFCGHGFAHVPGSCLQRALCRASEGLGVGDGLSPEDLIAHFGAVDIPAAFFSIVVVVAGIRGGKTFLACCAMVRAAFRADLSQAVEHEIPRAAIVGPDLDASTATFTILRGIVESSAVLTACLDGEPTADTLVLRRPHDGRRVEICSVAASRGGSHLRARWLVGAVLDECALFGSESAGAAVNAEELFRAAQTRLLPGGQVWLISSPFGPQGLLYDQWKEYFGKPGEGDTLICHAPTRALNPAFPQAVIDKIQKKTPDVAAREYYAQWLDAESSLLTQAEIDACMRTAPAELLPEPGHEYVACIDPATRGNAWTLALGTLKRGVGGRLRKAVVLTREWQGSKSAPLKPREVFREIRAVLRPFGVDVLVSDQWSNDALRESAESEGLCLQVRNTTAEEKKQRFYQFQVDVAQNDIELPPDPVVIRDLGSIKKRATSSGWQIVLPRTPDGRHADHASSVSLLDVLLQVPPEDQAEETEAERIERKDMERLARRALSTGQHFTEEYADLDDWQNDAA